MDDFVGAWLLMFSVVCFSRSTSPKLFIQDLLTSGSSISRLLKIQQLSKCHVSCPFIDDAKSPCELFKNIDDVWAAVFWEIVSFQLNLLLEPFLSDSSLVTLPSHGPQCWTVINFQQLCSCIQHNLHMFIIGPPLTVSVTQGWFFVLTSSNWGFQLKSCGCCRHWPQHSSLRQTGGVNQYSGLPLSIPSFGNNIYIHK